jgi:hypothetical protein
MGQLESLKELRIVQPEKKKERKKYIYIYIYIYIYHHALFITSNEDPSEF